MKEAAFGIEDLQSLVLTVAYDHPRLRIDGDAVRQIELARPLALRAPFKLKPAVGREFHHTRVFVAIAHIKRTIAQHGDIGGQVEVRVIVPGTARSPRVSSSLPSGVNLKT